LTGQAPLSQGLLPSISQQLVEVLGVADVAYLGERFMSVRRSRTESTEIAATAPT